LFITTFIEKHYTRPLTNYSLCNSLIFKHKHNKNSFQVLQTTNRNIGKQHRSVCRKHNKRQWSNIPIWCSLWRRYSQE